MSDEKYFNKVYSSINSLSLSERVSMPAHKKDVPKYSQFSSKRGDEFFFAFETTLGLSYHESIKELFDEYENILKELGLNVDTEVFLRFHLSDITNQEIILENELKNRNRTSSFCSIIGQPPVSGSKIAVEGYHIKAKLGIQKKRIGNNVLRVCHGQYESMWARNIPNVSNNAYEETAEIFNTLYMLLNNDERKIKKNILRTWLYVRDIDKNYQGMVDSRRKIFDQLELRIKPHFIASTGIEGHRGQLSQSVSMDSLTVFNLAYPQIEFMYVPDYMNSPYEYNVTFERGTRIMYGDRSHYYISGTASIDNEGNILHIGNVGKQTKRTLKNINALLDRYDASLENLKLLIVYLREFSDYDSVKKVLKEKLPHEVPYIILRAPVCRPLWLVEIEGIAVSSLSNAQYASFC